MHPGARSVSFLSLHGAGGGEGQEGRGGRLPCTTSADSEHPQVGQEVSISANPGTIQQRPGKTETDTGAPAISAMWKGDSTNPFHPYSLTLSWTRKGLDSLQVRCRELPVLLNPCLGSGRIRVQFSSRNVEFAMDFAWIEYEAKKQRCSKLHPVIALGE